MQGLSCPPSHLTSQPSAGLTLLTLSTFDEMTASQSENISLECWADVEGVQFREQLICPAQLSQDTEPREGEGRHKDVEQGMCQGCPSTTSFLLFLPGPYLLHSLSIRQYLRDDGFSPLD